MSASFYVIVIPGILGTRLYLGPLKVYPSPLMPLLGLKNGAKDAIVPGDVIEDSWWGDHYQTLIARLSTASAAGSPNRVHKVVTFPYDWRRPIEPQEEAARLAAVIRAVPPQHQVALVAHSMGGLLAKYCLHQYPRETARVSHLFTIGTPWLGAPEAFYNAKCGMPTPWVTLPYAAKLARTWPSVYQLMPSEPYFDELPEPRHFLEEGAAKTPVGYGDTRDKVDVLSPNGFYTRYNHRGIRTWITQPLPPHVAHHALVGTGLPTVQRFALDTAGWVAGAEMESGDGTVTTKSAAWVEKHGAVVRYVKNCRHNSLGAAEPVWTYIREVLTTGQKPVAVVGLTDRPEEAGGHVLSVECPVDVLITTDSPAMAGVLGEYEINTLPDVTAQRLEGGHKLVVLPPDAAPYTIALRGTGTGAMTLRHLSLQPGHDPKFSLYRDVPLERDRMAHLDLTVEGPVLRMVSGDGTVETVPVDSHDPRVWTDRTPPEIFARIRGRELEAGVEEVWFSRADKDPMVEFEAVDERGDCRLEFLWQGQWRPCPLSFDAPRDMQATLRLRATDLAGNTTHRDFRIGWAATPPAVQVDVLGARGPLGEYLNEAVIKPRVRSIAPLAGIEAKVNGEAITLDVQNPELGLHNPGNYRIVIAATDRAGNHGTSQELHLIVSSRQEVAVTGERFAAFRTAALRAMAVDTLAFPVDRVTVEGRPVDPSAPLPLARSYDFTISLPAGDGSTRQVTEQVRLNLRSRWLPPVLQGGQLESVERFGCKYTLSGPDVPENWWQRVEARVETARGDAMLVPDVQYRPKLGALLVEGSCQNLRAGDYRLRIRSGGVLLAEQSFRVIT